MNHPDLSAAQVAIASLQKDVRNLRRRWMWTFIVGFVAGGVICGKDTVQQAIAQTTRVSPAQSIRATQIEIVNRDGAVVVKLGSEGGQPILHMNDREGLERVVLGVTRVNSGDDGPVLRMSNSGKQGLQIRGPSRYQHPEVHLYGEDEKGRAEVRLHVIGSSPALWMFKDDKRIWQAP